VKGRVYGLAGEAAARAQNTKAARVSDRCAGFLMFGNEHTRSLPFEYIHLMASGFEQLQGAYTAAADYHAALIRYFNAKSSRVQGRIKETAEQALAAADVYRAQLQARIEQMIAVEDGSRPDDIQQEEIRRIERVIELLDLQTSRIKSE